MAEPTPQWDWSDLIAHIAYRERETEIVSSNPVQNEANNPYWELSDIELLLAEISNRLLREIPQPDLESLGSLALQFLTLSSGDALPLNTIDVLGVTIQTSTTTGKWYPAQYVSPASWFQVYGANPDMVITRWTVFNGQFWCSGTSGKAVVLLEPQLSDYQSDTLILPPVGYDEIRVDWVHKMLQVEDFMPGGRV
jgi:hypothetical protein